MEERISSNEKYKGRIRPLAASDKKEKKQNQFIKDLLDEYNDISIYDKDKNIVFYPNTERFKEYLYKHYDIPHKINKNKKIVIKENHIIFPSNFFCEYKKGISYVRHHYVGSWLPEINLYSSNKIFNNISLRIYTIRKGCLRNQIKNVIGIPILCIPRFRKSTIVVSIGRK